jgi:MoxR-like ATPase
MQRIDKKIEDSLKKIELIYNIITEKFFGQKKIVEQVLVSILSSGNTLIVGVPGLGKTLLFKTLSESLKLESRRIQCTPDLMPFDIIGTEILSSKDIKKFSFIKGPIFCQILMVDEINRASPRTQSALLQAMQEGFITVNGKNFELPKPFIVLATENPIEQEGTYNLPEAQLDRFLMQINISYPEIETEKKILIGLPDKKKSSYNFQSENLIELISVINELPVGESVLSFVLNLIRNLRPESSKFDFIKKYIKWGPGPRGGQALLRASKARALIRGNLSPTISDAIAFAQPTLRHRISLTFEAKTEDLTTDYLIKKVCDNLN